MAIGPGLGRTTLATSVPKAKSTAAAKVANDAERQQACDALRLTWFKWDRFHRENICCGEPANAHGLEQCEKAKRALGEFDKQCKPDENARLMEEASALFFKIDAAIHECESRRGELQERIQRETRQNLFRFLFRFSVLTDEWNKLKGEREAARTKTNEASCYRIDEGPADYSQLVSTLRDSGKFTDDALEILPTQFLELQKAQSSCGAMPISGGT